MTKYEMYVLINRMLEALEEKEVAEFMSILNGFG